MKKQTHLFLALVVCAYLRPFFILAQEHKKWLPDHATCQFAGNTGMVALSAGYTFLNQRLMLESGIGYTPAMDSRRAIYTLNIKGLYRSRYSLRIKNMIIRPLNAGVVFSYSTGEAFNRYNNRNLYPKNYYWFHPWFRYGAVYQACAVTHIHNGIFNDLELYLEAGWWNQGIYNLIAKENSSFLNAWDITVAGAGLRLHLR